MTDLSCGFHGLVTALCWTASPGTFPVAKRQITTMKIKRFICSMVILGVLTGLTGCMTEREEKEEHKEKEAKLESQAKISKADAEKIALGKVPGGTIKEGELEKEKGKLIWS